MRCFDTMQELHPWIHRALQRPGAVPTRAPATVTTTLFWPPEGQRTTKCSTRGNSRYEGVDTWTPIRRAAVPATPLS